MTRTEIVEEMLRRYAEAQETMHRGNPGDGGAVTLMPETWNASYRELERLLKRMRSERPSQWWHVTERYLRCREQMTEVRVIRTRKGPEFKLPPHSELGAGAPQIAGQFARVRLTVWSPSVRAEKVRRGVQWLADGFSCEPFLPVEFLPEKAAA